MVGKAALAFYAERLGVPDIFTAPWFLALPAVLLFLYVATADSEPLNWGLGVLSAVSLLTLSVGYLREVNLVVDSAGMGFEVFTRRDRLKSLEAEAVQLSKRTAAHGLPIPVAACTIAAQMLHAQDTAQCRAGESPSSCWVRLTATPQVARELSLGTRNALGPKFPDASPSG